LPLEAVAEVMTVPGAIAALPHTEQILLGVFDLRGAVLPAVSLRALLGLAERRVQGDERIVVVRIGGHRLALLVDQVSVILRAARRRGRPRAQPVQSRGGGGADRLRPAAA
jgi:purine-binding chemotaxis protein CheW